MNGITHEGAITKLSWNSLNNLILSAGEDCRFKIWDSYGRQIFSSSPFDYVVTSVAWAPNGEYFAIGAFGMLKLCDKSGWTHSHQKTDYGSIMDLEWSKDSSMLAAATAKGFSFLAYVTNKVISWENWEATLQGDTEITVNNILDDRNGV